MKRREESNLNANVRLMTRSDSEFAVDLANQENWNYDLEDLDRLQFLFPKGCFIAEHERKRAGWVVACTYGDLAWISSLVVSSNLRGKGIGAALVNHAVRYAHDMGVKTVGLYSYMWSIGFYEKVGFRRNCDFDYVVGKGRRVDVRTETQRVARFDEVVGFDHEYFRGDRRPLLDLLHRQYPGLLLKLQRTDLLGYIAGKSYSDDSAEIGPWVCDSTQAEVAEQLFAAEISRLESRSIGLTIPCENLEARRIVDKYGFQVKQKVHRMLMGRTEDLPRIEGIHAAAGLDVG